ncbi:DNA helicase loader [Morganella phage vB_Mm5]
MIFNRPFVDSDANSRITALSVCKLYLVMKNHFSGKFDAIHYKWNMKISEHTFEKRKDKYYFQKLAKRYTFRELYLFFMSNFIENPDFWIGDIDNGIETYQTYVGRLKRLDTVFSDELTNIYQFAKSRNIPLGKIFEYSTKSKTSYIVKLVQSKVVSYEVFLLLDCVLDIINKHDQIANDLIWSEFSKKIKAYKKIIVLDDKDKLKYTKIFKETINKLR